MHQLMLHVLKRVVHQLRPNQHQHLQLMEKIIVQMGIVQLITMQIVQKYQQ